MSAVIIRRVTDLRLLLRDDNVEFTLAIEALADDNPLWEARLRKDYEECGCDAGALGLIAGLALGAATWLVGLSWWQAAAASLGAGIAGLALAKTIRQAAARTSFHRNIAQIEDMASMKERVAGRPMKAI